MVAKRKKIVAVAVVAGLIAPLAGVSLAQDQSPAFGTEEDIAYAGDLWSAMEALQLVGDAAITARPYEGTEPHGAILQTLRTRATVRGHEGTLIVKRNYGPEDVTLTQVWEAPAENLDSVTVMYQREEGYDPDFNDWFWVKYLPDGSLDANEQGMKLAGQVAKGAGSEGAHAGCIGCHERAAGDDLIYTNDE